MAGAGYKLFNTGDVLLASEVNTYLQQQVTMVFANATARTSALSGVLAEGMMSYLQDTNSVEVYNGSSWVNVGNAGDITEVQAGTGISVASGTGPIPVVTNTVATTFDAKGDLVVGTGADTFAKLTVGTNGHTLVADSAETTGLKWAAPAGGFTWTTYAPTYTNITIGNGTAVAQYAVSGNLVFIRYLLTWGSTTSFSGAIRFSPPSGYNADTSLGTGSIDAGWAGNVVMRDASVGTQNAGWTYIKSATEIGVHLLNASGTYASVGTSPDATTPFTWTTSDELSIQMWYRSA